MINKTLNLAVCSIIVFGAWSLHASPSQNEINKCVIIVKKILDSPANDERILSEYYAEEFAQLIRQGHLTTDEDPVPYFDGGMIEETNGMEVKILSVGPGCTAGEKILVPVTLQHVGFDGPRKPFVKTWVFVRDGNGWRAKDMLMSPLLRKNAKESLHEELSEVFGSGKSSRTVQAKASAAGSDSSNPSSLIVGVWQGGRHKVEYKPNGTVVMDPDPNDPGVEGVWRIDGNTLVEQFSVRRTNGS